MWFYYRCFFSLWVIQSSPVLRMTRYLDGSRTPWTVNTSCLSLPANLPTIRHMPPHGITLSTFSVVFLLLNQYCCLFYSCLSLQRSLLRYRDGRLLAAGGRSRFIHLWDLDTHRLLRIIELPVKVTAVKQLVFLPDNFDAGANQVCQL